MEIRTACLMCADLVSGPRTCSPGPIDREHAQPRRSAQAKSHHSASNVGLTTTCTPADSPLRRLIRSFVNSRYGRNSRRSLRI